MRGPLLAVALLLPALAGCLSSGEDVPAPAASLPFPLSFDGQGCRELIAAVPADEARVRAALPEGLQLSGSGYLGAPRQAGKVTLLLNIVDCATGNVSTAPALFHLGEVYVSVVPPEGSEAEGAIFDFLAFSGDSRAAATFTEGGWPMMSLNAAYTRTRGPAGPAVIHAVWQGEDFEYVLDGTLDSSAPQPSPGTTIDSHQLVNGTLVRFPWVLGDGQLLGVGAGRFTATPGSLVANLLGATEAPASVFLVTFSEYRSAAPPSAV
ncbi:MAG TPA: hypothetical protein VNZ52_00695 [Candidatus Thermoplasmatota archaeon]|nr:hypothetical protein [Candidatus Thermoplasmatota archaeon]